MNKLFAPFITFAVIASLWWGLAVPAHAQEELVSDTMLMFVGEELYTVSAASRREESVRSAPAAVTVLGRKELQRYRTLADAVRSVPGFYVEDNGIKEQLYLRGVVDSFLVLIDGVPMANDSSNVDYPRGLDLSLDYVKQIEIVRTPGSALWGADAFSGVINVVTREGKDIDGTILKAEVGSFDTQTGNVLAGYSEGAIDFVAFASYTESQGFEPDDSRSRQDDIFRELYGKLTIGDTLTVSGRYSNYNNYFTNNTLQNHDGQDNTPFSFLQATYTDEWWYNVQADIKAYVQYFENYQKENYLTDDIQSLPFLSLFESELDQDNWRYGFDAKFDTTILDNHIVSLGFSWEYDDASSTTFDIWADTTAFIYKGKVSIYPGFDSYRLGCFLQDTYKISDTIELTGGVRLDKHEDFHRKISPRFSLVWLPYEYLDVKLFYGQAYRTPDLYALALDSGVDPEKITSYEGEISFRLHRGLVIKGSYFYNVLEDLLENVTQGQERQSGREVEQGTEFSIQAQPYEGLALYANHTFLFGERQRKDPSTLSLRFETDDGRIAYNRRFVYHFAPDHVVNLGASYTWRKNYTANVEVHYTDTRDIAQDFYGANRGSLPPYWTTDVNLFAKKLLDDKLDLSLKTRNIFNQRFKHRGNFELLESGGRSWYLSAQWKF